MESDPVIAGATIPKTPQPIQGTQDAPIIMIDGVPEARIVVDEVRIDSPLDTRLAQLHVVGFEDRARLLDCGHDREAVVLLAHRLADDQIRHTVLVHGRMSAAGADTKANLDSRGILYVDAWSRELSGSLGYVWWARDGVLFTDDTKKAVIGPWQENNRSSDAWAINGESAYVLQGDGLPWTVGSALQTVSAMSGMKLMLHQLPEALYNASLTQAIDLYDPIGVLLRRLCDTYGLVIRREMTLEGGGVNERRVVRPAALGREVPVTMTAASGMPGDTLRMSSASERLMAQKWIARCRGWLVESTLSMNKGWDPALEGGVDSDYGKSTSSNFEAYSNVYRLWILNEDGRFSGAPFLQGDPFDLQAFFDEGPIEPQPLRFLSGLTLDGAGNRMAPIVEVSTNSGVTWSVYGGIARVLTDCAGVYLDDASLPASFLSAAQSGTAAVRVTASLQSPREVELSRWNGNPFTGAGEPLIHDLNDTFRFQRVADTSIHKAGVEAGTLQALEADDSLSMWRWLVDQMSNGRDAGADAGRATLTLAGTWPMLRVGDRIRAKGADGLTLDGAIDDGRRRLARVRSIRCEWAGYAPLTGSSNTGALPGLGGPPRTRVELDL